MEFGTIECMSPDCPLVSVVTPTYNAARFLEQSIESVITQDYLNIEYLVVDSYSSDHTDQILDKYNCCVRKITVPRNGPACAIDAGFQQARGSILAWLNADDCYAPGAVRSMVEMFDKHPGADVVYGDVDWIDQSGKQIGRYPTRPFDMRVLARDCFISQPAVFFRASLYRECPLDQSLPLSFDYDLWIRFAALHRRFEYLPQKLAYSRMHTECLSMSRRREVFEVSMALLKRHYGYIPLSWIFGYLSFLRDGRDQFFQPLQFSAPVFAASVALCLFWNRLRPVHAVRDSGTTIARGLRRQALHITGRSPAAHPVESPEPGIGPLIAAKAPKVLEPPDIV